MTSRAEEYARRRGLLQLRCTAQRQRMEQSMAQIARDFGRFERSIDAVRKFRVPPLLLVAAAALALGLGGGRTIGLLGRAWVLFNSFQRIKRSILPTGSSR
jgi:hypothetical protein